MFTGTTIIFAIDLFQSLYDQRYDKYTGYAFQSLYDQMYKYTGYAVIINNVCAALRIKQPDTLRAVPTGGTTRPVSPGILNTSVDKVQEVPQEIRRFIAPKLHSTPKESIHFEFRWVSTQNLHHVGPIRGHGG